MRLVAVADVAPVPWKNGGGLTRELLRVGDGDDWRLRISVADIAADGPFSSFPGVTRWFAVLDGAGVRLALADRVMDVRPGGDAIRFDGAAAPGCTLVAGATRDLNVMVRDDAGQASVARASLREKCRTLGTAGAGFFALRPLRLHGPGDDAIEMPALSLCWQSPPFGATRPWWIEPLDDAASAEDHTRDLPGYWISLHATAAP